MLPCWKKKGETEIPGDKRRGCGGWGRRPTQCVIVESIEHLLIVAFEWMGGDWCDGRQQYLTF